MLLVGWLVIGIAVAVTLGSFFARQGTGAPVLWNVGAGVIGGFIGGYIFLLMGQMALPGPEYIISLLGSAIVAAVLVLLVRVIKK